MDGLILYLHGFRSSPLSWKVQALRQAMAERGRAERLLAPALPPAPAQAMILLESLICQSDGPITLVGSSLGGWYATWLAEKYDLEAVLINPAVVSELDLSSFMGPQASLHDDSVFEFTPAHAGQLLALDIPRPDPARYLLLLETGDRVLDYRLAANRYAGCKQVILAGGDHSFTQFPRFIPQILEFAGL
ncbi:MAG: YqiA/YcfP family alpha/beta fold hydrolase [Azovibrio sp.]|uniref:YqiA/YcfP family alpha/beta fold hydrolase n=1 Tax=Azovibrio sp. TaxID=1872673 RepID=UPI003C754121